MPTFNNSKDAAAALRYLFTDCDVKKAYIALLDARRKLISTHLIAIGSEMSVTVSRKKIARIALINNASLVILAHNHPSNDVTPSKGDVALTKNLSALLQICDIPLIDHIIMGKDKHFSFTDDAVINF